MFSICAPLNEKTDKTVYILLQIEQHCREDAPRQCCHFCTQTIGYGSFIIEKAIKNRKGRSTQSPPMFCVAFPLQFKKLYLNTYFASIVEIPISKT